MRLITQIRSDVKTEILMSEISGNDRLTGSSRAIIPYNLEILMLAISCVDPIEDDHSFAGKLICRAA
jgi:hypothetical protein